MNNLIRGALAGLVFVGICFSQTIPDIQFKDMTGKSYGTYSLLEEGKHIYILTAFNG